MNGRNEELFPACVKDAADRHELTVPDGTTLDVATSALQKNIRRGEEADSIYWALQLERWFPWHCWRRLAQIACEDVGGDAIVIVQACRQAYADHVLGPERRKSGTGTSRSRPDGVLVTHAVLTMCRSPKSREADNAKVAVEAMVQEGWRPEIGEHVLDVHTQVGKQRFKDAPDDVLDELWHLEWAKVENETGPYVWRDWHWRRLGILDDEDES